LKTSNYIAQIYIKLSLCFLFIFTRQPEDETALVNAKIIARINEKDFFASIDTVDWATGRASGP